MSTCMYNFTSLRSQSILASKQYNSEVIKKINEFSIQ